MIPQTKAYIALIFICIVWGTTYLAIRVGVLHYPAFLFAGVRQVISGIVLLTGALLVNKNKDMSWPNIRRQMLVGFLLLTVGNGCVTWGEKTVPSGIAALICSLMPIFAVLFNLVSSSREKFNWIIGAGMLLGTGGVALIFRHSITEVSNSAYLLGIGAILLATSCWALGSIINRKNTNPVNPFFNSGLQLFFGGIFMLVLSPAVDDFSNFQPWDKNGLIALAYLIVFGSVLAYTAYMYVLSKLPVGIATIYAYVNPLVAVVLGALLLHEEVSIYTVLAFVAIISSVVIVNRGYRKQNQLTKDSYNGNPVAGTAASDS
ncbi:MAG: EamA family transporter [Taibaiella sp.]|nr:EamA family transporter [Taibaiella sp.]